MRRNPSKYLWSLYRLLMAISKVASHRFLCCVPTVYVYMVKCYFINVKK